MLAAFLAKHRSEIKAGNGLNTRQRREHQSFYRGDRGRENGE